MSRRPLTSEQRLWVERFFAGLHAEGIDFLVLRGGNSLPSHIEGNDIDILLQQKNLVSARRVLERLLPDCGLRLVHTHKRSYFSAFWLASVHAPESAPLHIDLYPGAFTWKGLSYLGADVALKNKVFRANIPFSSASHEATNLLLTSLLWGGFIKKPHAERASLLLSDPKVRLESEEILRSKLGSPLSLFTTVLTEDPAASLLKKHASTLRSGLIRKAFASHPAPTLKDLFLYVWGEIKAWAKPPGISVAILGADGSGKSLLLDNLTRAIGPYFGEVKSFHWRPAVLPDIGVLLRQRHSAHGMAVPDPHGKPAHGAFSSLVRLFYYLLDFHLGWWLKVYPAKARNHLVVFDRYAGDMYVDPRRYRLGLPAWLIRILCQTSPQPDLTFVLLAPSEVLLARKQEVSPLELEKILSRLKEWIHIDGTAIEIDCSKTPQEVSLQVITAIQSRLINRLKR